MLIQHPDHAANGWFFIKIADYETNLLQLFFKFDNALYVLNINRTFARVLF